MKKLLMFFGLLIMAIFLFGCAEDALVGEALRYKTGSEDLMGIISNEKMEYCVKMERSNCKNMNEQEYFSFMLRNPVFAADFAVRETKGAKNFRDYDSYEKSIQGKINLLEKVSSGKGRASDYKKAHLIIGNIYNPDMKTANMLLFGDQLYADSLGVPVDVLSKAHKALNVQRIQEWAEKASEFAEQQSSGAGGGSGGSLNMPNVGGLMNIGACLEGLKSGGKSSSGVKSGAGGSTNPGMGSQASPGDGGNFGGGSQGSTTGDVHSQPGTGAQGTGVSGAQGSWNDCNNGLDSGKTGGFAGADTEGSSDDYSIDSETNDYQDSNGNQVYEEHTTTTNLQTGHTMEDKQTSVIGGGGETYTQEVTLTDGDGNVIYQGTGVKKGSGETQWTETGTFPKGSGFSFDPEGSAGNTCGGGGLGACVAGTLADAGGCYDGNDQSNWVKMSGDVDTSGCGSGSGGAPAAAFFDFAGWDVTDPNPMDLEALDSVIEQKGVDSLEAANFAAEVLS